MCINTCLAYTGPFAPFEKCPTCGKDRYESCKSSHNKKVLRCMFTTIPIGPQIQALWQHSKSAKRMHYH
ncbi:hypothetical protein CONPUDRAFT_54640 [Coniophora puteana RWD-64-598 SS2]|uniref:Uncharacterized protein n=1 Tax=Coniophora puteana (strain RWD-64-598) TaxID=741705 RepID=A0A5M3MTL2_CONPW|nr:uncharacterized protein CONPUDRAFT_54640 [Coniophora puteana RWD-64-598 SS2]EIW82005.1 hypothetical protein CONPUDRAFT_54640 [Coniophora puteana RWD-64-598 SS2]